ncbi:MAG: UDP-N-acetylglucosamine 2-epimerase (non-hydrolyzing) [Bacteroidota bacterium]
MIKILTIIGARPQIIKAAALSRAIRDKYSEKIKEVILHTGQHYDENMSKIFFDELQIPQPDYNLNVGSNSHAKQTAAMIEGIEKITLAEKPHCLVVYGDTNSTMAVAVAASKIHFPIVHIEAGLRSFNKTMPEEINRIMCDHVSTLLFSPTKTGINNLVAEGFKKDNKPPYNSDNPKIYHCGDVMYDNSIHFSEFALKNTSILKDNDLDPGNFILVTIHRDNNTDNKERLYSLFNALNKISKQDNIQIILPLHPRTTRILKKNLTAELYDTIENNTLLNIIPAVSYLNMIVLEHHSKLILTDSGGVQKEAYFFKKPCIILRKETEWLELVWNGNAIITDADETRILKAYNLLKSKTDFTYPPIFGDGKAAEFICEEIIKHI